jgi:hypothetical protein
MLPGLLCREIKAAELQELAEPQSKIAACDTN